VFFLSLVLASEKNRKKPRKQFHRLTQDLVLFSQKFRWKFCKIMLEFPEFDHIDGNSSNNDISNYQALCPNCHTKKLENS